jgi:hypothetical protein
MRPLLIPALAEDHACGGIGARTAALYEKIFQMKRPPTEAASSHTRQMASDPIKTAHEPTANDNHKTSAAITALPKRIRTLSKCNYDTEA